MVETQPGSADDTTGAQPGAGAADPVDPKDTEITRLTGLLEDSQHKLSSAEGRLRGRPDNSAQVAELGVQMQRFTREFRRNQILNDDELKPEETAAKLGKLSDEERTEDENNRLIRYRTRAANRLNLKLQEAGISEDNNPSVREAVARWRTTRTMDEVDDLMDEVEDIIAKPQSDAAKAKGEKEETERKEGNANRGSLELGAQVSGSAGSVSDQAWLDAYSDEVKGGIPATPANAARAKALIDKGMRARVRAT